MLQYWRAWEKANTTADEGRGRVKAERNMKRKIKIKKRTSDRGVREHENKKRAGREKAKQKEKASQTSHFCLAVVPRKLTSEQILLGGKEPRSPESLSSTVHWTPLPLPN